MASGSSTTCLLSHYHPDHAGGFPALLERFPGTLLFDNGPLPTSAPRGSLALAGTVAALVCRRHLSSGERITWQGVQIAVLWPEAPGPGLNCHSMVLRADYAGHTVLLMGDVDRYVERRLVERGLPSCPALLVAGHHAAKDTGDSRFLQILRPWLTAVSVDADNRHGYPDEDVIASLSAASSRLWRTDRDGELCLLLEAVERGPHLCPDMHMH